MLCQDALIEKCLAARPDQTVESLLADMRKGGVSFAPVLEDGVLVGLFSIGILLEDLLPVSVTMGAAASGGGEGGSASIVIPSAPGMATRLRRNLTTPVSALMRRSVTPLRPDMPLEAAARALRAAAGDPVPVAAPDGDKFLGLVTPESVLAVLEKKAA